MQDKKKKEWKKKDLVWSSTGVQNAHEAQFDLSSEMLKGHRLLYSQLANIWLVAENISKIFFSLFIFIAYLSDNC